MTPTERRVRALEARLDRGVLRDVPRIVVEPWETVDEVLERDGVVPAAGQRRGCPTLIVRQIIDPMTVIDAVPIVGEIEGASEWLSAGTPRIIPL